MPDLSKLSDKDLLALESGDVGALSDGALLELDRQYGGEAPAQEDDPSFMDKVGAVGRAFTTQGNLFMAGPFSDELVLAPVATAGTTAIRGARGEGISWDQIKSDYISNLANIQESLRKDREAAPVGTTVAEVAGALTTGGPIAQKIATSYPQTAQAVANYARTKPVRTSAGAGMVSGGVYGFGTGTGSPEERLEETAQAGTIGGLAGPAGYMVSKGVGNLAHRIGPYTKKVLDKIRKKTGAPIKSGTATAPVSAQGASVNLPTGAAKGDVSMMRAEEAARQGLLGDEYQAMMGQIDEAFLGDVTDVVKDLAGSDATSEELLESGIGMLKNRAKAAKRLTSRMMKARNDKLARAKVYKDYTKNTLGKSVNDLKADPGFKVNLPKESMKPIREEFETLSRIMGEKGKGLNLADLQAWRAGLNNYRPGTQEGVMARQMAKSYDDWLKGITRSAFKEGDDDTVEALLKANKDYAGFKGRFGTDKYKGQASIIEDIVTKDELTPDHLVNMTFGKTLKGTNRTTQSVKRMVEAIPEGPKRQALRADLKGGLVMRAFEGAEKAGSVSPAKLRTNLINLKGHRAFRDYLATPEDMSGLNSLINDLGKYVEATSRRDVYSPSGPAVLRGLENILNGFGLVTSPMGGRAITEPIKAAVKQGKLGPDKTLVEKSLQEFSDNLIQAGKSSYALYGGAGAGVAGANLVEPQVTVTPAPEDQRAPDVVNEQDWIKTPSGYQSRN